MKINKMKVGSPESFIDALNARIDELETNDISSSTSIKAADEVADIDYLDELVEHIEDALYDKGYGADQILVENDGVGYITVSVSVSDDTPDVLYMISIDDIEPIWEDIIKDSEFIADAVVNQVIDETGSDGVVASKQITASTDDADRHIKDLIKLGFYKTKENRYHYDINENYGAEYYPNDEFGGFIYDKNTDLDVEHNLSIPQMIKAINEYRSK